MAIGAAVMVLSSCNDMLDEKPRSEFSNTPEFWSNANQVESYTNKFYDNFVGYSSGGGRGTFFFSSLSDDQANPNFDNWTYVTVPNSASDWNNPFVEIRRANYLLQGMDVSTLSDNVKNNFRAIARLNRAWQYFSLVKKYGDVQWLDKVILDLNDKNAINQARTDRDVVMDNIVADLDYAIANLSTKKAGNEFSVDLAQAMKSDVCLYEGTYCKYRTQEDNGKAADIERSKKYLGLAVDACEALMKTYTLSDNYGDVYNSLDLSQNPEVIFWRNYVKDVVTHGLVDYTTGSTAQRGITKDAIDAFLFLDGKPLATTGKNKDDAAVLDANGNYNISHMLAQRDKRLGVLVDSIVCFKGHGWKRSENILEMTSSTAYTIHKFDNDKMADECRTSNNKAYTDAPLFWLAVIYLNYAEAKAELGTITQEQLNISVNKLQARAGLPDLTLNPAADPANNHGVSNLLWEIRRTRRCELMTDGYRYWDLVRWHQLDKLDTNRYNNLNLGANLSNVVDCEMTLENGYAVAIAAKRTFDKKYYFYPVPQNQITLADKTSQNLGW